jgi:hypothetical protein
MAVWAAVLLLWLGLLILWLPQLILPTLGGPAAAFLAAPTAVCAGLFLVYAAYHTIVLGVALKARRRVTATSDEASTSNPAGPAHRPVGILLTVCDDFCPDATDT